MAKDINHHQTILVTGCAGFIASKISELLLEHGDTVVGVDNLNDTYAPPLKEWRLAQLQKFPALVPSFGKGHPPLKKGGRGDLGGIFEYEQNDITCLDAMKELFQQHSFDAVMNLAARAGVRVSVENPWVYIETNITGPVKLKQVIHLIEQSLGKKAQIEYQPRHPADILATWADISKAKELLGWRPLVSIEEGIQNTVSWYLENREWVRNVGSFER